MARGDSNKMEALLITDLSAIDSQSLETNHRHPGKPPLTAKTTHPSLDHEFLIDTTGTEGGKRYHFKVTFQGSPRTKTKSAIPMIYT